MYPLYLFADSQLLFWKENGKPFLSSIRDLLTAQDPKAAYIGASNGDVPEFYEIFTAAMDSVGITTCRMIPASFSSEDASFLEQADLILLAGGDVGRGWRTLQKTGMAEIVRKRYVDGAVLIGVSAGAVQLGLYGCEEKAVGQHELFDTLKLAPYFIDVHDETREWSRLQETLALMGKPVKGLAIPAGAGVIVHADQTLEPIRHGIEQFQLNERELSRSLLLPL